MGLEIVQKLKQWVKIQPRVSAVPRFDPLPVDSVIQPLYNLPLNSRLQPVHVNFAVIVILQGMQLLLSPSDWTFFRCQ